MELEHKKEYESLFRNIKYGELIYAMSILSDMIEKLQIDGNKSVSSHLEDVKEMIVRYVKKDKEHRKN